MEITGISATPVHVQNDNQIPPAKDEPEIKENKPVSVPNQTVEANRQETLEVGAQIDLTA